MSFYMKDNQFVEVPQQLKIQIIRKVPLSIRREPFDYFQCYPIPYVRLRRSCRFVDEFCEINRKFLGIYSYCNDPHLCFSTVSTLYVPYFNADPVQFSCCEAPWLMRIQEAELDRTMCVVINYCRNRRSKNTNIAIAVTKENIPRIRGTLSGFAFTHMSVVCFCLLGRWLDD